MNGATVSGFFSAVQAPFPISIWDDGVAALAQLGAADPKALYGAVAAAIEEASGAPEALRHLQAYLEDHLVSPTLEGAAAALSISERTLQRRLSDAQTTFSDQIQEARLRRAEARLLETDEPVTRIALSLGFNTSQHFSSVFRKRRGVTPTELRRKRRRAP
jgi:AraC-like DNA-binding protein